MDGGVYSLGCFLASLSWSTYVLNCVGAGIELQKQWMETMPAINAFFAQIDACGPGNDNRGEAASATPVLACVVAAE